ncbi:MAG: quinone-dependent dihydroorotate dehydrogenase [Neisseriaceae bacterium]|nr:MAG: quinone-dependent dihydroorotate dehydrogenase [Neisseriaceae bacterium]
MFYNLVKRFLLSMDEEKSHIYSLKLLKLFYRFNLLKPFFMAQYPSTLMGLEISNPIGLAAGLDKNGEYIDALASLGFGFIEIGTVTPRPQLGNPKPRLFRIPEKNAIINRMGFNNKGVDYMIEQIKESHYKGVLGVNIGKNYDTPIENALEDYLTCLTKIYPYASYICVNISSPNTKNLRELQNKKHIEHLLSSLKSAQKDLEIQHQKYVPLMIKIAPDLTLEQIKDIAKIAIEVSLDGITCSNTTVDKILIEGDPLAKENGGLSGAPLFEKSNKILTTLLKELDGNIPVIGVGGINSGKDALHKLELGASAVQLYTGLIYQGPSLVTKCIKICSEPVIYN